MASREYGHEDEIDAGYRPLRRIAKSEQTVTRWQHRGPTYGPHPLFQNGKEFHDEQQAFPGTAADRSGTPDADERETG
jgi:hypothetical protein